MIVGSHTNMQGTSHNFAHSPTLLSLYLRHSSFLNPSVASPMSQLTPQPFRYFTYITAQSRTLLREFCSFSNPSVTSPTSQLILQTLPSLYLCHCSLSNPSVISPTSQFNLQPFFISSAHSPTHPSLHLRHSSFFKPFRRFTYVTAHSPTLPLLHLCHSSISKPSLSPHTSQTLHLIHLASRPCSSNSSLVIIFCCVLL